VNKKTFKYSLLFILVLVFLSALLMGCSDAPDAGPDPDTADPVADSDEPMKIGVATSLLRNDFSWGEGTYRGVQVLRDKYPDAIIEFADAVPMVDQVSLARDWANQGFDLVALWGYEFFDTAVEVAPDFPNTWFAVSCAPEPGSAGMPENLASAYFTEEEAGYLAGVLAASMTETNKVAYMSGTELPCGAKTLNMFRLGAYDVNPDVEVVWAFVGTWADLAKERETAESLIDLGCDIIFSQWVGLAAADACAERGIKMIGSHHLSEYKPEIVLADHNMDMRISLEYLVDMIAAGTMEARPYMMTMEKGITDLIINEDLVPADAIAAIESAKQDILSGKIKMDKIVSILPAIWPHVEVANYTDFLEPEYKLLR